MLLACSFIKTYPRRCHWSWWSLLLLRLLIHLGLRLLCVVSLPHIHLLGCQWEHLLNAFSSFGWCLEELLYFLFFAKFSCSCLVNLSLWVVTVALVANQVHQNFWASMSFDLAQPLLNILKCLLASNVIAQEYNVGTSIENASDWSERLLTSSVPNLQLGDLLIQLNNEGPELNTDGNLML